jgi:prevent-host-death family protein
MPVDKPSRWTLQDAKNRFSELVRRVLTDGPQMVTRGRAGVREGQDTVVVLSMADYQRLVGRAGSLLAFLQRSPLSDVDLDIDRPRDAGRAVSL